MQTVHLPAVPPDLSKINTDGLLESEISAAPTAPPPLADAPSGQTDPWPTPPPPAHSTKEPVPGAFSDLVEAVVKERRETWAAFAKHCMEQGDSHGLQAVDLYAFPVTYNQDGQGGMNAAITALDWKFLARLRSTVSEFGLHAEPTKQMLDYFWSTYLLLPSDLRSITRMILTEHQQLLFNAHWQALVNESVAEQRPPRDPLHGVTIDELMGMGPYTCPEAQVHLGPDKIREAMDLVRRALDRVKEPGGVPLYMSLKQGRDESFGEYVDKLTAAITRAGVPDYMKGTMLKQCVLQNATSTIKQIISTMGPYWTIEELLEKALVVPTGENAFLVNAIQDLAKGLKEQAQSSQAQVLAALAPLQAKAHNFAEGKARSKCYQMTPTNNFSPNNPFHGQENNCSLPQPTVADYNQPQPIVSDYNLPQPVASDWIWQQQ
ncbi:PREDICTED: uncharacterized protein LOC108500820 isoform X1 [Lepidothrix coronata]|uniref:Uncharacterized protein LOC108500820 isoform X1 n=1 Tax=Lepidothrix coronata TaxID=321398 RepID=A0A6J0HSR4_9PASS|nr:PREDICTED: uncharacterized protein LOC108500820 isoform X1 [Lepidothrix coronata]